MRYMAQKNLAGSYEASDQTVLVTRVEFREIWTCGVSALFERCPLHINFPLWWSWTDIQIWDVLKGDNRQTTTETATVTYCNEFGSAGGSSCWFLPSHCCLIFAPWFYFWYCKAPSQFILCFVNKCIYIYIYANFPTVGLLKVFFFY